MPITLIAKNENLLRLLNLIHMKLALSINKQ